MLLLSQSWAFAPLLARAPSPTGFGAGKREFAGFHRHKILKSRIRGLSKAGARWYIPAATQGLARVAFSGSLRMGSIGAFQALAKSISALGFSTRRAMVYRGVEQPGSSSGS
jgi:hypothetical protein